MDCLSAGCICIRLSIQFLIFFGPSEPVVLPIFFLRCLASMQVLYSAYHRRIIEGYTAGGVICVAQEGICQVGCNGGFAERDIPSLHRGVETQGLCDQVGYDLLQGLTCIFKRYLASKGKARLYGQHILGGAGQTLSSSVVCYKDLTFQRQARHHHHVEHGSLQLRLQPPSTVAPMLLQQM